MMDSTANILIFVYLENTCSPDEGLTYRINGPEVIPLGFGDTHEREYDPLVISEQFIQTNYDANLIPDGVCPTGLKFYFYPSSDLENSFKTNRAIHFTAFIVAVFAFTSLIFILYDFFVRRRQNIVMQRVIRQDKIMANVFPSNIRDRMLLDDGRHNDNSDTDLLDDNNIFGSAPLAELYPSATIVFADIVGFTAWSSTREPPQVFKLLENIYSSFDRIAYRMGVYKGESSFPAGRPMVSICLKIV